MKSVKNQIKDVIRFKGERFSLFVVIAIMLLILYGFFEINIFLMTGVIIVSLLYVRLLQAQQLGNSLKISKHQFPEINTLVEECAAALDIRRIPKVYISQDPTLNAFTMGFKSPYTIVLNSALVEKFNQNELKAVIGHEMGHVKFKHTMILSLISPVGQNIAFMDFLFGFWQRRTEYTADRCALICSQDKDIVIKTLTKIAGGAKVGENVDLDKIMLQLQDSRAKKMDRAGELLGSHPYIVKRIWALIKFSHQYKPDTCQKCGNLNQREANFCWACGNKIK